MSTNTHADTRTDELLAIRCRLGERNAFDELIARWHGPIWRYLRRLADTDDVASDLSQDTWLRVLRGIANLQEPASLRPWLFGIARRVAIDRLRRKYADPTEPDTALDELAAPEPDAELADEFAALETRFAALPFRDRETLALFYLRELRIDEIAALLAVPPGTVKSRLHRARRLLRKESTGENP